MIPEFSSRSISPDEAGAADLTGRVVSTSAGLSTVNRFCRRPAVEAERRDRRVSSRAYNNLPGKFHVLPVPRAVPQITTDANGVLKGSAQEARIDVASTMGATEVASGLRLNAASQADVPHGDLPRALALLEPPKRSYKPGGCTTALPSATPSFCMFISCTETS